MRALFFIVFVLGMTLSAVGQMNAWSKRVGSGTQDEASFVSATSDSAYFVSFSDGRCVVTRLEDRNGGTVWRRILGLGRAKAFVLDRRGWLIIATNERDASGRTHAVTYCLDQATGATRWRTVGLGSIGNGSEANSVVSGDLVYVGGTLDGDATVVGLDPILGLPRAEFTLPGTSVANMAGSFEFDRFHGLGIVTEGEGALHLANIRPGGTLAFTKRLWFSAAQGLVHNNPRLVMGAPNGFIIVGEMHLPGKSSDVYSIAYDAALDRVIYRKSYASAGIDEALDIGSPWWQSNSGAGVQALVRSTDLGGRIRTFECSLSSGPNQVPLPRELRFAAKHYSRSAFALNASLLVIGEGFMSQTGWDVIIENTWPTELTSFDAGMSSDDHVVGSTWYHGLYHAVTTYRAGRSEARIVKTMFSSLFDFSWHVGNGEQVWLSVGGFAPSGGFDMKLATAPDAPIRLPLTVSVPAGAHRVLISAPRYAVQSRTEVPVKITAQGRTRTAMLTLMPVTLGSLSATPTSVLGGSSVTARLKLTGPAPIGGFVATLTSTQGIVGLPATITVPQGQWETTFEVRTLATPTDKTATVYSFAGGQSRSARFTILGEK